MPTRQLVAKIPWGHNLLILNKLTGPAARLYYLRATAQFGWTHSVLLNQIKAGAYERAVAEKKTHNFELALPEDGAERRGPGPETPNHVRIVRLNGGGQDGPRNERQRP